MHRSVLRGIGLIAVAIAIIVVMFVLPGPKPAHEEHEERNLDPWVLVSTDPDAKYGTYLGNGFISTRIMGDGVGSQNGKPLECYMSGLYVNEKLVPTPTWSDLRFYDGKDEFRIDKEEPYKQTLNMRTGVFVTKATWRSGGKTLDGSIQVIVSRTRPNVALVLATMTASFEGKVRVATPLGGVDRRRDRVHSSFGVPHGMKKPVCATVVQFGSPRSSLWGGEVRVVSYLDSEAAVGGSWLLKQPGQYIDISVKRDYQFMVKSYACLDAEVPTWPGRVTLSYSKEPSTIHPLRVPDLRDAVNSDMDLIEEHKAAWEKLWRKDIIIDGPAKDQQALHACMFYILQSVREGSDWSIPPMGLSSTEFSGHVFWDADTWIFPALLLQHPELARSIVDYRYKTLPGAMENARRSGCKGAEYAWESGATGIEDTPPNLSYRHERHVNGDVALAQWQYYLATGDRKWLKERGFPVIKATADYWVSRVMLNKDKNRYEILKVVPPDENVEIIDNSVYTNAIAQMNLMIAERAAKLVGARPDPKWADVAKRMYIPFDAKKQRFIAHDRYRGFDAKQADAELLVYPLQYSPPLLPGEGRGEVDLPLTPSHGEGGKYIARVWKNTYDFYAPKVITNGPAMSNSAHSVIAARLGDREAAYSEFVGSYKPYLRGPFSLFNEKKTESWEKMCFLTGAAGPIQAATYGMAGIRMDYFSAGDGLAGLSFKPCLPKQWKSLKITGLQWRGTPFEVTVGQDNKVKIGGVPCLP